MTSTAILNKSTILGRLERGEHLADIARDLGIAVPNISKHLAHDPDYVAAREAAAEVRLDQRERELESAANMVEVSKHSALLKHQAWRCEREFPHRWGKEPGSGTTVNVVVSRLGYKVEQEVAGQVVDQQGVQVSHFNDENGGK